MRTGRANPGTSSHPFLWSSPPTSGRGTEDVKEGKCWCSGAGKDGGFHDRLGPRGRRRGRAVLSGGAGRRCGAPRDAPAPRRLVDPGRSQSGGLCWRSAEELGRVRPGPEGGSGPPQSRGGLGADYSGTSKIRALGSDPLRGSDERSGGPCAAAGGTRPCSQAEEDGPGCLSGVGPSVSHLPVFSMCKMGLR